MTVRAEVGIRLEDFVRLYEAEGPFELVDGERVPLSPNVFGPAFFANRIARLLKHYSAPRRIGQAFVETAFVLNIWR